MNDVFEKIVALIEQDFYDELFLSEHWPAIRQSHRARLAEANAVAEQELVLKSLLESLGVSHSLLIDPELARYIATQYKTATPSSFHINTYGHVLFCIYSFFRRTSFTFG